MKCIQQPELAGDDCDPRLRAIYCEAHKHVRASGQFHEALGSCEPESLGTAIEVLELVVASTLDRKYEKGNDTRWRFEAETLDRKVLDTAHPYA